MARRLAIGTALVRRSRLPHSTAVWQLRRLVGRPHVRPALHARRVAAAGTAGGRGDRSSRTGTRYRTAIGLALLWSVVVAAPARSCSRTSAGTCIPPTSIVITSGSGTGRTRRSRARGAVVQVRRIFRCSRIADLVRILYFADIRFPLERANGIQTMETCHALAGRGHEVRLVVRPDTHSPGARSVRLLRAAAICRAHRRTSAGCRAGIRAPCRLSVLRGWARPRMRHEQTSCMTRDLGRRRPLLARAARAARAAGVRIARVCTGRGRSNARARERCAGAKYGEN